LLSSLALPPTLGIERPLGSQTLRYLSSVHCSRHISRRARPTRAIRTFSYTPTEPDVFHDRLAFNVANSSTARAPDDDDDDDNDNGNDNDV
jgi:hypothetical protein